MIHSKRILKERLGRRHQVIPETGCHEWTKSTSSGYGRVWDGERLWYAHRLMWTVHRGAIPEGYDVLHSCDNPRCINLRHLWLGTQQDNMLDKVRKGRHLVSVAAMHAARPATGVRGSRHPKSKLTDTQAEHIKSLRGQSKGTVVAQQFGVSTSLVYGIWHGRNRSY